MNSRTLRCAIVGLAAMLASACTATSETPSPQTAAAAGAASIDANTWMVGQWTGTSQAGVPFTLTISPTLDVQYTFGGRQLPMQKPSVNGQTVTIPFAIPGETIRIAPTGQNSGTWAYQGSQGFSRSTITRKSS